MSHVLLHSASGPFGGCPLRNLKTAVTSCWSPCLTNVIVTTCCHVRFYLNDVKKQQRMQCIVSVLLNDLVLQFHGKKRDLSVHWKSYFLQPYHPLFKLGHSFLKAHLILFFCFARLEAEVTLTVTKLWTELSWIHLEPICPHQCRYVNPNSGLTGPRSSVEESDQETDYVPSGSIAEQIWIIWVLWVTWHDLGIERLLESTSALKEAFEPQDSILKDVYVQGLSCRSRLTHALYV